MMKIKPIVRGASAYFTAWVALVVFAVTSMKQEAAAGSIAAEFKHLTRQSAWRPAGEIPLRFRTYHPQGMTIVSDRFYLSSVEVVNRAESLGAGHFFEVGFDGRLLRSITLGEGAMYHPGGMDYDGREIWVPVAEYRPNSRSIVYAVDPSTFGARKVFAFEDHLGAVVHDTVRRQLIGVNWGSRKFYRWPLVAGAAGWVPEHPETPVEMENPGHYVDYQDAQVLPLDGLVLFGGVGRFATPNGGGAFALGGLDLLDPVTMRTVRQVPVPLWVSPSLSMTNNPFYVTALVGGGLRFYFLPEDDDSTIYIYETGGDQDG